jgi:hypothetical protein
MTDHGHPLAIPLVPADRSFDLAAQWGGQAPAEGNVAPFEGACREGSGQGIACQLSLRHDHDA